MSIKKLRQKKNLSQEELAETTGLSLRTIQRVESGESVSTTSWKTLASYFGMSIEALQENNLIVDPAADQGLSQQRLAHHRAAQLIIFIVVFFVAVSQWLAYYASLSPGNSPADLWTILSYVSQIAIAAAVFAYLFNHAKITFVWSYYATTAAFFIVAIGIDIWTDPFSDSASYQLLYPVYYTLFLIALLLIHVLQMALSLKGESAILLQR